MGKGATSMKKIGIRKIYAKYIGQNGQSWEKGWIFSRKEMWLGTEVVSWKYTGTSAVAGME